MESKIKTRRIQLFVRVLLTLNQQDPIISLRGRLGPIKQVFPRTHFIAVSVLSQEREREREREARIYWCWGMDVAAVCTIFRCGIVCFDLYSILQIKKG
jgi:hypothetical protein